MAGGEISTPKACTPSRKTFGNRGVMKERSNDEDGVPQRKVPYSKVGRGTPRRGDTRI